MSSARRFNVAVVGATGVVGREMLRVLEQRGFPAAGVRAVATARSAGSKLPYGGSELTVLEIGEEVFDGIEVALFSAGASASREWAPVAVRKGALVVDNSSAWRMDPEVPLVVPEVNPETIPRHRGIIANGNCCAIPLAVVLHVLGTEAPLRRVVVSTYQAASGAGIKLVDELARQTAALAAGRPAEAEVYPHPLAHNVVPGGWKPAEGGYSEEEAKVMAEVRKMLDRPDLRVAVTCVRVPVPVGHGEAVFVEFDAPLEPERARELLAAAPGVQVVDDYAGQRYPTPAAAAGEDDVFVGRIRRDESVEHGLALWVVSDNLRKGAALNAVQVAEKAIEMGVLV